MDADASRLEAVWAASTVDEGIELLTGRPAGERRNDGSFPEGSVHRLADDRLRDYAERLRRFAVLADGQPRTAAGSPEKSRSRQRRTQQ
jgi:hypothetical protein